jgi:DNA-binding beta-propeller fold protein YncE
MLPPALSPTAAFLFLGTLNFEYDQGMNTQLTRIAAHPGVRVVFGVLLLVFCAASIAQDESEQEAIFYPPAPDVPRLQFLKKFASSLDMTTEKKAFRDFVFGGEANEGKLVEKPYGVAIHSGAIYVVDTRGGGYGIFDLANETTRFVRPGGRAGLIKPINITIDADGTRYITDTERGQIVVLDANDKYVAAFGDREQMQPVDVAIIGDKLFVTNVERNQIHIMDKHTGEILKTFGRGGEGPGELHHPTNLAVGPEGTLFVSDTTNFRIQEFNQDGSFIKQIGSVGTRHGQFARPKGVAVDREGRIYAVDAAFENVQILAPDGAPLLAFAGPGYAPDSINMPTVVKIDYENVDYFQQYAAPNFELEYLVLVASQYGPNRVTVFGFGESLD